MRCLYTADEPVVPQDITEDESDAMPCPDSPNTAFEESSSLSCRACCSNITNTQVQYFLSLLYVRASTMCTGVGCVIQISKALDLWGMQPSCCKECR